MNVFMTKKGRGALLSLALCATAALAGDPPRWTASWGAAVVASMPKIVNADAEADVAGTTYRQIMRLSLGGTRLRLRVSNLHGDAPLVIGAATVARGQVGSDSVDVRGLRTVRFGGAASISIVAGAEALSDEIALDVDGERDVAVTLHVTSEPARRTVHVAAHATQFKASGNWTTAARLDGTQQLTSWHYISGIEVLAQAVPVLVAAGDSLTDGSGSGRDANARWTDWLQRRIAAEGLTPQAVINAGIGGNQMLRDGLGVKLLDRFERDVLRRSGVTDVVVLIGVNDLGRQHKADRDTPPARAALLKELQEGWRRLVLQARARGICVVAATVPPYGSSTLYRPAPHNDADRRELNEWMRTSTLFDAVADFDRAVSDPATPANLQQRYDSGDGLHLSPLGYRALADAVPLDALASCRKRLAER